MLLLKTFSPAVAQPTVLDTVKQDTTDETKKDVELKTEDKPRRMVLLGNRQNLQTQKRKRKQRKLLRRSRKKLLRVK